MGHLNALADIGWWMEEIPVLFPLLVIKQLIGSLSIILDVGPFM